MRNIFLDKAIFNDEFETTKETIKIKIDWHDYNIFFDYITDNNFMLGENGFELPDFTDNFQLIENIDNNIYVNVPSGFSAKINNFPATNKIKMSFGDVAVLKRNNISIEIERTNAGKKFAAPLIEGANKFIYTGMSGILHLLVIATLAFFVPPLGITDNEDIFKDNLFLMQQYLSASAEREQEAKQTEDVATDNADDREGGTGKRAMGEEGSMGNPTSRDTNKRFAIAGPKDNMDVRIAREAALRDASRFGMIGLLTTASGGDPNSPTAPWGRDDALGNDAISARGNMWGNEIGESFGAGGLGLSGVGDGGGGKYEGIGLGSIGTIGHGAGLGDKQGFGNGHGHLNGGHKVKVPAVRFGTTIATGRLPAEVIQRIVRQNYGRFRVCYEAGLRSNPNLQGRVTVRFIIGRDGSVSNVGNGGSDLPDQNVTQCVIKGFYGLSFPAPENGIVSVVYPIMFSSN